MAIIRLENVTHNYGDKTPLCVSAIKNVNIEIEQGELVGIIGHTGSGKSTLIQHLNGLLAPTKGRVFIEGEDIWQNKKNIRNVRFKVGLCFQYPEYQLFEETVYKDIAFGPRNMKLSEEEIRQRVYEAADFVGLSRELLEKSPFDLSGGEKRRAAIAGVMAMKPKILVLDEPTAGLDPQGKESILNMILRYKKATDATVLIVTHNMEDIARIATKILVMNRAEVYLYDTVKNVFAHSEELEQMGLTVPQVTRICRELNKRGLTLDESIYTVEDACAALLPLLKKGVG